MCCWHSEVCENNPASLSTEADKASLKFICWRKKKSLSGHGAAHVRGERERGERCNAKAHKLGESATWDLRSAWKANQKAWRNLTAGRLASHPPPPLLHGGGSFESLQPWLNINPFIAPPWFPVRLSEIPMEQEIKTHEKNNNWSVCYTHGYNA